MLYSFFNFGKSRLSTVLEKTLPQISRENILNYYNRIFDSKNVIIETNLIKNPDGTYTSNEEGTYYIAYTVNNFKYGTLFKIQKIRLITFVEATEEGEMQGGGI